MGNKSEVAGILSIVSGVVGLVGALFFILVIVCTNRIFGMVSALDPTASAEMTTFSGIFSLLYGIIGVIIGLIAVLAVVGGIYSIKKQYWGLGLAGAIAAALIFKACGIAALVLISLGKEEFNRSVTASPAPQSQPVSQN